MEEKQREQKGSSLKCSIVGAVKKNQHGDKGSLSKALFLFFWDGVLLRRPGWSAVAQSVPLGFKQLSASASWVAGITGTHHHACLIFVFLVEMGFNLVGQLVLNSWIHVFCLHWLPKVLGLQVWATVPSCVCRLHKKIRVCVKHNGDKGENK